MIRRVWPGVWPLGLIALVGLVLWADRNGALRGTAEMKHLQVPCATLTSGCSVQVDGRLIRFGLSAAPKPLTPFQIWVVATAVGKAEARFSMEGMDMGFNLYTLRPDHAGVLRTVVTLPICVTGRRDWNLILDIDNTRLSIPFVTNL